MKNIFKLLFASLFVVNFSCHDSENVIDGVLDYETGAILRTISIDKSTNDLSGCDEIIKKKDGKPLNYSLRFHLYTGLTVVKTIGGNSVLIQLSKNKSLIFTIKNESILIEKSIFLGGNKILDNTCLTISGNLVNKDKTIHWEIRKNI